MSRERRRVPPISLKPCSARSCFVPLPAQTAALYCPEHWSLIPDVVQREIGEAFLAVRAAGPRHSAPLARLRDLLDATNARIELAEKRRRLRREAASSDPDPEGVP